MTDLFKVIQPESVRVAFKTVNSAPCPPGGCYHQQAEAFIFTYHASGPVVSASAALAPFIQTTALGRSGHEPILQTRNRN